MRVAIIGGGISGLTVANTLYQNNIPFELFEKNSNSHPQGSGILLGPSAIKVLCKLGLRKKIKENGCKLKKMGFKSHKGDNFNISSSEELENLTGEGFYGIGRDSLSQTLRSKLEPRNMHYNKSIKNVIEHNDHIQLILSDGNSKRFDYIVGCDGLNSIVREKSFGKSFLRPTNMTCWRGILGVDDNFLNSLDDSFFEYWGKNSRFGVGPISNKKIYWFAVIKNESIKANSNWKTQFSDYLETIPKIISATKDSNIIKRELSDKPPSNTWYSERVVLVGDAIHPTTPNLGIGASLGIESAWRLGNLVDRLGWNSKTFKEYQKNRFTRTKKLNYLSLIVGKMAHIENPILQTIRNSLLKYTPNNSSKKLAKLYLFDL